MDHADATHAPTHPHAPPERTALIRRLIDQLREEPHQPHFRQVPHGAPVQGWPARLQAYFWPHPVMNLRATQETMTPWFDEAAALSRRFLSGDGWMAEERRRAAVLAWSMLTWGGVTQQDAFSEATVEAVFRRALGVAGGHDAPMNSGWTKVAALATAFLEGDPERAPHVMWDSRVSTAIVPRLDGPLSADPRRARRRVAWCDDRCRLPLRISQANPGLTAPRWERRIVCCMFTALAHACRNIATP